jgi:hypothetical protein
MPSTLSSAATKCISDVPGLPNRPRHPIREPFVKDFLRRLSWFLVRAMERQIQGGGSLGGSLVPSRQTKALSPVMDLPTINVFISLVPS